MMNRGWWWVAALLVTGGCKEEVDGGSADGDADADSDSDGDTDGDADADGDADGDGDGDVSSVTFILLDELTDLPLDGARLAADLPTGERIELVSGPDGRVAVQGIVWAAGTLSVTSYLDGYVLFSRLGIDASFVAGSSLVDGAVPLAARPLPPVPETEMVTLSGTFMNAANDRHVVDVNVLRTFPVVGLWHRPEFVHNVGTEWAGPASERFSIRVPRGLPFTLQAFEVGRLEALPSGQGEQMPFYQVAMREFEPLDEDLGDVAVDFATDGAPTRTAEFSFLLPDRPESPVRAATYGCGVNEATSWYLLGWRQYIDVSADGDSVDVSMIWTEPAWASPYTVFGSAQPRADDAVSGAVMMGYPQDGQVGRIWDVPEWVAPSDPEVARPLHDPLQWELFDDDNENLSITVLGAHHREVWVVMLPPDATTATLPEVPAWVDAPTLFGSRSSELEAYVALFDWDDVEKIFTRFSRNESARLMQ